MPFMLAPLLAATLAQHPGTESAVGARAEEIVLHLLYQLLVILLVTRIVTAVVRRLGQTDVSGEILAGLLLGPSFLSSGLFGSQVQAWMKELFHPSTSLIFVGFAQIGLVLLMFQIGLEFEFDTHLGRDRKPVLLISAAGLVLPFVLGFLTAPWFHARLADPRPDAFGFQLFFAVAMSITAIPILGRIFMELGLSHTRTAALTIGAAAIDDVCGWLVLGAIGMMVRGAFTLAWVAPRLLGLLGYLALLFFLIGPPLKRAVARHVEARGGLSIRAISYLLVLLFVSATITSNLGVFAIIGGFLVGVLLHGNRAFVAEWKRRVGPLVQVFFLPIFFAYTGLRTDVGTIAGWSGLLQLLLILLIAFASKFGGAYAAARLCGEEHRSACTIGVCMNTRALMELIALNIGKDLGLLPTSIFSMLVIMAIVSTFMATPLIRRLMRGQERLPDEAQGSLPPVGLAGASTS